MLRFIRCVQCRALLLTGLLFVGAGCGPDEAAEIAVAPPGTEPASTSAAAPLAPGSVRVEYLDGRVSLLSNGAGRLAILERLAEMAGFELFTGEVQRHALTLRIESAPLGEALAALLERVPYSLEYDRDPTTGRNALVSLTVGRPVSVAAEQEPELPASPVLASTTSALDRARTRYERVSPGERQRRHDTYYAETEAMEPELIALLDDPDPAVRAEAVSDLPLRGNGEVGAERLRRMSALLSDPDSHVRISAVERLGEGNSPEVANSLVEALSDPSREVVLAAIAALEDVDHPSAISHLEPLREDHDPEIREAAEFAIEWLEW